MRALAITLTAGLLFVADSRASLVMLDDGTPPTTAIDPNLPIDGSLFLNSAFIGGGDTPTSSATVSVIRSFDLNAAAGAPGVPGTVTLQGFSFASPGSWTPRASSFRLTFTYLGLNGVYDGVTAIDDVVIGTTEAIGFDDGVSGNGLGYEGAGRYLVNFDSDPSAPIDGANEVFRITIAPLGGAVRFKTLSNLAGDDPISDAKFSVSGTFAAIPEPCSMVFFSGLGAVGALLRHRPPTYR